MRDSINQTPKELQRSAEAFLLLLAGGVLYYGIEILWRGHSHISMAICGAVCFFLLYRMNQRLRRRSLPFRALIGAAIITVVELVTGCVVNLLLGLGVWDYSALPLNLFGQICLLYSVLWFLLCIPALLLCQAIERHVFLYNG